MISQIIPQPYRDQLVNIGRMANAREERPTDELAVISKAIDRIQRECARNHPEIFIEVKADE